MKRSSLKTISDTLSFYGAFGRPLTLVELFTHVGSDVCTPAELLTFLNEGVTRGALRTEDGFFWKKEFALSSAERKTQDLFLDEKWKKLEKLSRWFRHVPFFDFVMLSGSMSFGNVHESSDFDVVTGVRAGRMFTARYFASALFSLLHARRLDDLQASSPDKLCFNHFVTEATYEKEPHNFYRRELYRAMIPLWCANDSCGAFIHANAWSGMSNSALLDRHRILSAKSALARSVEYILNGRIGDFVERRIARPVALRRLSAYRVRKTDAESEYGKRVVIDDKELEFHFVLNYEKKFEALGDRVS